MCGKERGGSVSEGGGGRWGHECTQLWTMGCEL